MWVLRRDGWTDGAFSIKEITLQSYCVEQGKSICHEYDTKDNNNNNKRRTINFSVVEYVGSIIKGLGCAVNNWWVEAVN